MDTKDYVNDYVNDYVIEFKARVPIFTYILIAINIFIWVAMNLYAYLSGKNINELLHIFGAKNNESILLGEYWRFVTPVFLHGGIMHLLLNSYSLYISGILVERIFGHVKFLLIYFIANVVGNIASFIFSVNPSVGASGAIFGLFGAIVYYGFEKPKAYKRYFRRDIIMTIGISIAYGFSRSGIDNYGHLGGLVGGFLAAGVVKAGRNKTKYINRFTAFLLLTVVMTGGLYYGFHNTQNKGIMKINEAQKMLDAGNYEEAERIAEELLSAYQTDKAQKLSILRIAVLAEASQDNYDEAIEHAMVMKQIDPGYGNYILGLCYYDSGQYDLAKEALLQAKQHNVNISQIDQVLKMIEDRTSKRNE